MLSSIGRLFVRIVPLCRERQPRGYGCHGVDDMIEDTVIFVAQDKRAVGLDDDGLIAHFLYRFDMIRFQAMKEAQQLRETSYADHIQATEEKEDR